VVATRAASGRRSSPDTSQPTSKTTLLGLERALKLPVPAEGIERTGQLEFLEDKLRNEAQGYFLGRPDYIEGFREPTHGSGKAPSIDMPSESEALTARRRPGTRKIRPSTVVVPSVRYG
jgi:EAL domain-containing protein (putative c-di-GMP-specific phosphodiesterase class I)